MYYPELKSFRVRNEIILLLGIDNAGGSAIQRSLEAVGYPVLTADSREQANELFRSFDGAIRLLIIDITKIEKNVLEVIAALRKDNPTLKVIVASEDISSSYQQNIYISGVIEFIRKPVERNQLLQVVRRIVEK